MTGWYKMSLRNRIRLARLEFAITRMESTAIVALTIVLAPAAYLLAGIQLVPDTAWLAILSFGLAAEGALILASMTDSEAGIGHVRAMLETHFGVPGIGDDAIREQVARAIEYRARMEDVIGGKGRARSGAMSQTMAGVDSWLSGIGRLARRLDHFCDDASFQSADKLRLRERIDDLERCSREASDTKVQGQLRETIAGRWYQLRIIEELENLMERGALRLEHAVGALGAIYTQVTIFAAQSMDEGDAARLAREISDEIAQVDAVLAAMDRIFEPTADVSGHEKEKKRDNMLIGESNQTTLPRVHSIRGKDKTLN